MPARALLCIALFLSFSGVARPQSTPLFCATGAVNTIVHAEGITERLGDIVTTCTGGTTGATIRFNLAVFFNVEVTNRLTDSSVTDAFLTVDTGAGPAASGVPGILQTSNAVAFNGVTITLTGAPVSLRISNVRGNVSQLAAPSQVRALLSVNGTPSTLVTNNELLAVATPLPGLLATMSDTGIRCVGSPLPEEIHFRGLVLTGTAFVSARFTEGYAASFEKKSALEDHGTRVVARYSGLPPGARLFVPDVIAGSNAVQPTSAGHFGQAPSGGAYEPGTGSLLLARVRGADANGAGGTLAYTPGAPGSGVAVFNGAGEVALSNGAGIAVFEVVDSNPNARESAQFPTWLGLAPIQDGTSGSLAAMSISLGPVSTGFNASATLPVPRFVVVTPAPDCDSIGDCKASYFPAMSVTFPSPLEFTAEAGTNFQTKFIMIRNESGGLLSSFVSVADQSAPGPWVMVNPALGLNNRTVLVQVFPRALTAPGVYTANVVVDAGQAGRTTLPVKLTLTPASAVAPDPAPATPAPPAAPPVVSRVELHGMASAANPEWSGVAPGSLAIVKGAKLAGSAVSVTLDGVAAAVLASSADALRIRLPESLTPGTAQLEVTVDGDRSAALAVAISDLAPAVFTGGVLNEDSSVNTASNGAAVGSTVQIFSTGLMGAGVVPAAVKLHDRTLTPTFAGAAPGSAGVDQINAVIPADLPAMTTSLRVCGTRAGSTVCSDPVSVTLK